MDGDISDPEKQRIAGPHCFSQYNPGANFCRHSWKTFGQWSTDMNPTACVQWEYLNWLNFNSTISVISFRLRKFCHSTCDIEEFRHTPLKWPIKLMTGWVVQIYELENTWTVFAFYRWDRLEINKIQFLKDIIPLYLSSHALRSVEIYVYIHMIGLLVPFY